MNLIHSLRTILSRIKLDILLIAIAFAGLLLFFIKPNSNYDMVFMFTMTLLAIIYLLFGFAILKPKKPKQNLWVVLYGFGFSIAAMGLVFKFNFLHGWKQMNQIALVSLIFLLLLSIILNRFQWFQPYFQLLKSRIFFWFFMVLFSIGFPQKTYVTFAYRYYPELVNTYNEFVDNPCDILKFRQFDAAYEDYLDKRMPPRNN